MSIYLLRLRNLKQYQTSDDKYSNDPQKFCNIYLFCLKNHEIYLLLRIKDLLEQVLRKILTSNSKI